MASDIFDGLVIETFMDLLTAIVENLAEVTVQFPDFDLEEFYLLAKQINDFLNNPKFEDWTEIITESSICKSQIDNANDCIAEIETLNLKEVIKNNFTDFDSMHSELDKADCLKTLKLTSCVKVKELVIANPSFDHLNKIQDLFDKFS